MWPVATCNMPLATCNMQQATCNMQHATCNMQLATCNLQQRSTIDAHLVTNRIHKLGCFYCQQSRKTKDLS